MMIILIILIIADGLGGGPCQPGADPVRVRPRSRCGVLIHVYIYIYIYIHIYIYIYIIQGN